METLANNVVVVDRTDRLQPPAAIQLLLLEAMQSHFLLLLDICRPQVKILLQ